MSKEGLFFYFCVISKKKKSKKKILKKGEISKAGSGSRQVGVGVETGRGRGQGRGRGRPTCARAGVVAPLSSSAATLKLFSPALLSVALFVAHLLSKLLAPSIVAAQQSLAL